MQTERLSLNLNCSVTPGEDEKSVD